MHAGWKWDGYFYQAICGRRDYRPAILKPRRREVTCGRCLRSLARHDRIVEV